MIKPILRIVRSAQQEFHEQSSKMRDGIAQLYRLSYEHQPHSNELKCAFCGRIEGHFPGCAFMELKNAVKKYENAVKDTMGIRRYSREEQQEINKQVRGLNG